MKKPKEEKHVRDKLNDRQVKAINLAMVGNYHLLITVCLECTKALEKCWVAIEKGIPGWGEKTAEHYLSIRSYLESFIDDDEALKQYTKNLKEMEKEKNG